MDATRLRRLLTSAVAGTLLVGFVLVLSGCDDQAARVEPRAPMKVNIVVAARKDHVRVAYLTGVVNARATADMAFRTAGRVTERKAEVGQHVAKGDLLARLDPTEQQADIAAAQASVDAANAQLAQATTNFARQKDLLPKGLTSRVVYDQAQESLRVAQGTLDGALAQLANARDNLSFTELRATADGMVTTRNIEVGQMVQAAATAFSIAQDGDRDAVFNLPEVVIATYENPPPVSLRLLSDAKITATGRVREMSPVLDPETGTVRIKVEIPDTPKEMTLGAAVVGWVSAPPVNLIELPWSALYSLKGASAVWVVDAKSNVVTLKTIEVSAFDDRAVLVAGGLDEGERVVVAGTQLLSTGQVVTATEGKAP